MMNVCAQWWVLVSEFRRRSISDGGDESLFLAMNSWVWFQHRFQSSWVLLGFITVSGQGEFLGGVMDPVLGPRFSGSFLHMCLYFVFFGFITVSGRDEFLCGVMYPVLGPTFSGIFGFLLGFGFITVSGLWWISVWGDGSCLGATSVWLCFFIFCLFWVSSLCPDTINFCVGWWILFSGDDVLISVVPDTWKSFLGRGISDLCSSPFPDTMNFLMLRYRRKWLTPCLAIGN